MKIFITLFYIIIFSNISAQNYIIEYKNDADLLPAYQHLEDDDPSDFKASSNFPILKKKLERKLVYELLISDHKSVFRVKDLESSNNLLELIKKNKWLYYQDLKSNENFKIKSKHLKTFKIDQAQTKWDITQKTKTILGYNVIKATTKAEVQVEDFKTEVVSVDAWFTPELDLPYGPDGFGGLPGLILELNYYNKSLFCK